MILVSVKVLRAKDLSLLSILLIITAKTVVLPSAFTHTLQAGILSSLFVAAHVEEEGNNPTHAILKKEKKKKGTVTPDSCYFSDFPNCWN